jgi:glycerol-3-phosphate acyltransferase PlsY
MLAAGRETTVVVCCTIVALILLWRHRSNMMRMWRRDEHRFGSAA